MPEPQVSAPLLAGAGLCFSYGAIAALRSVDLHVRTGEVVCVIGPNGAGKSTLARVLGGLYRPSAGSVTIAGEPAPRAAHQVVSRGVGSVLEGRHLFTEQTVTTNLELGCYRSGLDRSAVQERLERMLTLFPALRARAHQRTATMSGGEQQMVAIGRALMAEPRVLILDEPSMGLAPKITAEVFEALERLRQGGLSILLIEQNAPLAFELANRGYLLRQGAVVVQGDIHELTSDDAVRQAYLGA